MPEQLCDALGECTDLKPVYRRLLKMALEQLQFLEQQIGQLDQEMAALLNHHRAARSHRSDLSFREMSLLLGWRMPRLRRESGSELQQPASEG